MPTLRSDVIIAMKADTRGVDQARASLLSLRDVGQGIGIAAGAGAFQAGTSALTSFLKRGIDFNAQLETAQIGIAAIFRQFDEKGQFKSFEDAMTASARAVSLLRKEAETSPATFSSLLGAFQATTGAMTSAGIPMEKQVTLINRMSQALAALGIRSEQVTQETRALITGNITEDAAAARILGIRKADVDAAKEQGRLYEFLNQKTAAFGEAGKRASGTYSVAVSNLNDALDALASKLAGPLSRALTQTAGDLTKAIGSLSAQDIRDIADGLASAARLAGKFAEGMLEVAKHAKEIGLVLAALKTAQIGTGLTRSLLAGAASSGAVAAAGGSGAALAAGGAALGVAAAVITVATASIAIGTMLGKAIGEPVANALVPTTQGNKSDDLVIRMARAATVGDRASFDKAMGDLRTWKQKDRPAVEWFGSYSTPKAILDAEAAAVKYAQVLEQVTADKARLARIAEYGERNSASIDARAALRARLDANEAALKYGTGADDKSRSALDKAAGRGAELRFGMATPEEQRAMAKATFEAAMKAAKEAGAAVLTDPSSAAKLRKAEADNALLESAAAYTKTLAPGQAAKPADLAPLFADSFSRIGGYQGGASLDTIPASQLDEARRANKFAEESLKVQKEIKAALSPGFA